MGQGSKIESQGSPRTVSGGYLFGVPVKDLGWFASVLMGLAAGFMAFFAGTFLGIVGIALYNSTTHRGMDLALSYKWFGLGAGVTVMVTSLSYLGMLWIRRQLRKS
jgi:hypothetical protein